MRIRYDFSSRRTRRIDPHNKHKRDFFTLGKEVILVSDIILEVLDARFIGRTRNKKIEEIILLKGKKIIHVINKSDLVNVKELRGSEEIKDFENCVFVSSTKKTGGKRLRDRIKIIAKRLIKERLKDGTDEKEINEKRDTEKLTKYRHGEGFKNFLKTGKEIHVGVIGYPNTGKSSLINLLAGSGSAKVSARSGFTKGIHKIKLSDDIILLDTPGIITEEDASSVQAKRLAHHSIIGSRTYDTVKSPDFIIAEIMKQYPNLLEKYYEIPAEGDSELLLEELGKRWSFLKKKGLIDLDRTARKVLKEWQEGKIKVI
ncbi:MAG: GTPase [Candidatus Pacearchaeota archaeon]|nr:GTPase [Candidatus Pacearchaeota archaeon]